MAFGILEPKAEGHVPGTVYIYDENKAEGSQDTSLLKHGIGRYSHIVLAPQPSDDPNDPLNWSSFEKHAILTILGFGAIVCGAGPGAILQAGVLPISQSLGVSLTQITLLAGYVLLSAGAFGIFVSGLARKFGKRPLYVFCSLMAVIGCIIGECAQTYPTLVAARVVQGFGVGAYESLIMASIGDLFFVHERGARVALVMFLLSTIGNGVLVIGGHITANLGWHYNFHILMPFVGLQFLLTIFFVPETTYIRKKTYEIDETGSDQNLAVLGQDEERHRHADEKLAKAVSHQAETISQITVQPARKTYVQRLAIFNGVFVRDSLIKMVIAPLAILLNIAASFNVVVTGITLAWFIAMSVGSSVYFSAPPYSLTPAGVGNTSAAPMIGGILAAIFMAVIAKPQLMWMVKRNNGIYEPEFQLLGSAVGAITSIAGMVSYGYTAQHFQSIYVICFCWGLTMFGLCIISISLSAYVLDAYRKHSTEIFIMNMLFKNFFYYGLTNYVVNWLLTQGPAKMFNIIAGINAGCVLTTIPMYIYGKRYRRFWAHHNMIKILRLETDLAGTEAAE